MSTGCHETSMVTQCPIRLIYCRKFLNHRPRPFRGPGIQLACHHFLGKVIPCMSTGCHETSMVIQCHAFNLLPEVFRTTAPDLLGVPIS